MTEWLVFNLPELARQPVVGGVCCAVPSSWLVEETIAKLPGVYGVRADDQQSTVVVHFDTERIDVRTICEELDGLGFGPSSVRREDERDAVSERAVL